MKDLAIYGAGGFGREIFCYIKRINDITPKWNFVGFFDDGKPKDESLQYGAILGGMEDLNNWKDPIDVVIAIATPSIVKSLVERITNPLVSFPNVIDPSVIFLDRSTVVMGKGNVIGPNSLIACNVHMGDFNLINWYNQFGHEDVLGNYNVVMPNVNISGGVEIGDLNFFGVKSAVLQYVKIGEGTVVGAASVIIRDTEDYTTCYGNPARVISRQSPKTENTEG